MSTRLVAFYLLLVAYSKKRAGSYFQHVPSTPLSANWRQSPGSMAHPNKFCGRPVKGITLTQTGPTIELFQPNTHIWPRQTGHCAITHLNPPFTLNLESTRLPASVPRLNLIYEISFGSNVESRRTHHKAQTPGDEKVRDSTSTRTTSYLQSHLHGLRKDPGVLDGPEECDVLGGLPLGGG
jgi:hypothetical protein